MEKLRIKSDLEKIIHDITPSSASDAMLEELNNSAFFLVSSGFKETTQISELLLLDMSSQFNFLNDSIVRSIIGASAPDFKMFVEITNIALSKGITSV